MSKLLSFSSNSSSWRHIFNGLQQNTQNIFLKITPTPSGYDHRRLVDIFWRPLYTDWKKHVSKVSNPFKNMVFLFEDGKIWAVKYEECEDTIFVKMIIILTSDYYLICSWAFIRGWPGSDPGVGGASMEFCLKYIISAARGSVMVVIQSSAEHKTATLNSSNALITEWRTNNILVVRKEACNFLREDNY